MPKHIRTAVNGGCVMPRMPSPNRIKTHYVYTVWEAAQALGRHRQTVIRWIKDKGLVADRSKVPWLIQGKDLKTIPWPPPRQIQNQVGTAPPFLPRVQSTARTGWQIRRIHTSVINDGYAQSALSGLRKHNKQGGSQGRSGCHSSKNRGHSSTG